MDRRAFLKGVGLASAAGLAGVVSTKGEMAVRELGMRQREAVAGGVHYRVDGGPLVWASRDAGRTWTRQSNLGDRYSIRSIRADSRGRVKITVAFDRRRFELVLAKSRTAWLVA